MFTGIVEELGIAQPPSSHRLVVRAQRVLSDLRVGDSIAVNGACLTVVEIRKPDFAVDLSEETLNRTNFRYLRPGDPLNLERALLAGGRMGGHIVEGHVDGVGPIRELAGPSERRMLWVQAPESLRRYIVEKGFVAVDGISLTVARLRGAEFGVAVIPYTLEQTNLSRRKPGDIVNVEVDILAKYVERLIAEGNAKRCR